LTPKRVVAALALAVGSAVLLAHPGAAQTTPKRYIAFGDSITFGVGDDPNRANPGYPPRLEQLLNSRGISATVINAGLSGEDTVGALTRVNRILQNGGDFFLLMEGTNDINEKVSSETTLFDLDQLAARAEAKGLQAVHVTIPPRLPSAGTDANNHLTADLAGAVRELAFSKQRRLVDPFEAFFHGTPDFSLLYSDKLHPNAAGYDLMARVFADVLTNADTMPPVTGLVDPSDGETNVLNTTPVRVALYDFGAGIDLANTKLLINGQQVDTPLNGSTKKVEISYTPPQPWLGIITVGLHTRDTATPPNTVDRTISTFMIAGTTFLPGDIDHNGRVDGFDLLFLAPAFGARRSDPGFRLTADLNGDGTVDGLDLAILASNFGHSTF
jgi:acyl-CoA thioesterase-1